MPKVPIAVQRQRRSAEWSVEAWLEDTLKLGEQLAKLPPEKPVSNENFSKLVVIIARTLLMLQKAKINSVGISKA